MHIFQVELNNSRLLPIFEIPVIDKNGNEDFIVCEISVKDNQLIAQRDVVSTAEQKSKYIAKSAIDIDSDCFTLDEHLQDLHAEVCNDILFGDLFNNN